MTAALIYRIQSPKKSNLGTLERNTGQVGLASLLCTQIAINPEIAGLKQHQDPASSGAKIINKQIVLDLAIQINNIGGNPLDAIKSGTFAPGNKGDNSGKGNTCDLQNDPVGCIFTLGLLVSDVTAAEIANAYLSVEKGELNLGFLGRVVRLLILVRRQRARR
jgi:hypothetical protein